VHPDAICGESLGGATHRVRGVAGGACVALRQHLRQLLPRLLQLVRLDVQVEGAVMQTKCTGVAWSAALPAEPVRGGSAPHDPTFQQEGRQLHKAGGIRK
jgi:hypothetical protein